MGASRLIRRLIMKVLSTLIVIASAGPLMKDNGGTILNWHGPHGGHHEFFDGAAYHHGGHGGPRDAQGQEIHGHGPHGGHPKSQMVNYAEVMEELKQQKKARIEAAKKRKHDKHDKHDKDHGKGHDKDHGLGGDLDMTANFGF